MELVYIVVLLAGLLWLGRGMFGFGKRGCNWMSADAPGEDGSLKWMCQTCGEVVSTDGDKPPNCNRSA